MTPASQQLDIIKKVWHIASPLTASRIFNVLGSFVGTLMIAYLGHTALAASALITATQATLFLILTSFLYSIGVLIGYAYGAKRYADIGQILEQGLVLSVGISLVGVAFTLAIKPILLALSQDPALVSVVQDYFKAYAFAIPMMMASVSIQQFLLAVEKQRIVFRLSVFSFIVFIVLAPLFIYGFGPVAKHGVTGLAIAIAIQNFIMLIIYLLIMLKLQDFAPYKIFANKFSQDFHFIKKMFTIGWPISLQVAGDLLSFFVITIMIGWLGESALAAQQIVVQYYILLVVPILSFSQASSILVSQAMGAENSLLAKRYGNATLVLGLFFSFIIVIVFVLFPHALVTIYSHGKTPLITVQLAVVVLTITGCRLLFDAIVEIKMGSLRGLFDTKVPMWIMLICLWPIYLSLAYYLGIILHYGLIGITIAGLIANIIGAVALWLRWVKKLRNIMIKT